MVKYMRKLSNNILNCLSERIGSFEFLSLSRKNSSCFIRDRKMPFKGFIYFMMNLVKKSLQIELTNFMQKFTTHKNISKSAFSQQRMNLKPEAFIDLNKLLVEKYYEDNSFKRWNGFRLVGIDGSTLELPKSEEILSVFGHDNGVPMARISTLYDLLNEFTIDGIISKYASSEIHMCLNHFPMLRKGDLVIMDRGYGARWLFYLLMQNQMDFVIRIQKGFGTEVDTFWEEKEMSKIIEVTNLPDKSKKMIGDVPPFKFRLVKVFLDTGEVEVLATSLIDEEKYPTQIFKDLYFKRWGSETNLNHHKNHLEMANFTGLSSLAVMQDFFANILICNIQILVLQDAQKMLDNTNKKREYKINKNLSLGYMKDRVIHILRSKNQNYYEQLVKLFLIEPVPIRPNRKNPRNDKRHKRKFYMNQKRCL